MLRNGAFCGTQPKLRPNQNPSFVLEAASCHVISAPAPSVPRAMPITAIAWGQPSRLLLKFWFVNHVAEWCVLWNPTQASFLKPQAATSYQRPPSVPRAMPITAIAWGQPSRLLLKFWFVNHVAEWCVLRNPTQASSSKPQAATSYQRPPSVPRAIPITAIAWREPSRLLLKFWFVNHVAEWCVLRNPTQASSSKPQAATSYQRLQRRIPVPINCRHNTKDESPRVRNESTQV